MKRYDVMVPVTNIQGHQFWEVDADSEADAIARVRDGGGDFVAEEVEVTELDFANAEASETEASDEP